MNDSARTIDVPLEGGDRVSGLELLPAGPPAAAYVLAHGAGAGMSHPFMAAAARGLAERGIATLRFNFPAMERQSKRVDSPAVAQAAVRSAVAEASRRLPGVPLFAGGKSFGGRMTSQAQAVAPLANVRGLAFLGFPLHPAGKPSIERAAHLDAVDLPMLFLQGSRDDLAHLDLLRPAVSRLGSRARLVILEGADHSFHVPAKSGRNDADALAEALDALAGWMLR
jgi:hypothetical protein